MEIIFVLIPGDLIRDKSRNLGGNTAVVLLYNILSKYFGTVVS